MHSVPSRPTHHNSRPTHQARALKDADTGDPATMSMRQDSGELPVFHPGPASVHVCICAMHPCFPSMLCVYAFSKALKAEDSGDPATVCSSKISRAIW